MIIVNLNLRFDFYINNCIKKYLISFYYLIEKILDLYIITLLMLAFK